MGHLLNSCIPFHASGSGRKTEGWKTTCLMLKVRSQSWLYVPRASRQFWRSSAQRADEGDWGRAYQFMSKIFLVINNILNTVQYRLTAAQYCFSSLSVDIGSV